VTFAFAVIRALHFASLMTVFGASALLSQAREIMVGDAKLYRPLFATSLVALATAALWLCFVAAEISGGTLFDADAIVAVVAKSTYGNVFILRFALLLWLCVLCLVGSHTVKTVVAGLALALLGLVSHGAAAGTPQYEYARAAVDALHLLCAAFWVGGLVVLVPEILARPRDMPRLIALLRLFSRWGAVSVAVLIAAGTLNGIFILDVPMRWNDTYVTWLAIKIVLAAVMVALALTNRFGVLPGLERGDREAGETIPLTVIAELSCALLILLIVGFLGLTAPMAM
jgi:copper resistance protein D